MANCSEEKHRLLRQAKSRGEIKMNLFLWVTVLIICFIMFKSIVGFIKGEGPGGIPGMQESRFSKELFYTLLIIYIIVLIGFGLIYFIVSFHQVILMEYGEMRKAGILESMIHSIYFSGVTLLTIGYGDIAPVGIGRLIALVQALIGYVLPTAFVLRIVQGERMKEKG